MRMKNYKKLNDLQKNACAMFPVLWLTAKGGPNNKEELGVYIDLLW